jgi:hypothetical protein
LANIAGVQVIPCRHYTTDGGDGMTGCFITSTARDAEFPDELRGLGHLPGTRLGIVYRATEGEPEFPASV